MNTDKKNIVRLGIIGLGNMGSSHVKTLEKGEIPNVKLTAICDIVKEKMDTCSNDYKKFTDSAELIRSGEVDAVIIATPHYSHTTIGIDALENGLHTLVEKPISVHKQDAAKLIAAHKDKNLVFSAMFNQRTDPHYIKLREIIQSGQLGEITRVNWIITNWYRTQAYYDNGGWRATWKGEGGGVLLNQCPHQLDLMQWLFGMPKKVRAYCKIGRFHNIEVEDAVTAYFEYENGATGVFITTTGEAPGTNRLEVCGEYGKIVIEEGKLNWTKNVVGQGEYCRTSDKAFDPPEVWKIEIPCNGAGPQHFGIIKNFVSAIVNGEKLLAPAEEGINSVELANSMLYSSFKDVQVTLPLDANQYAELLEDLKKNSKSTKDISAVSHVENMSASFTKA